MSRFLEYNFDGIVGPTHYYGGLSAGNLASTAHAGAPGNPRAAALEGLEKMRFLANLGVPQAVLPPARRPALYALDPLGYQASATSLLQVSKEAPGLLGAIYSASSMWTANAATVVPSSDTEDGRLHLLVANLSAMPHRNLEPPDTLRSLQRIFASTEHFVVHPPLPAFVGDEGAANQLRLFTSLGSVHLLAWGRRLGQPDNRLRFVARQSLEASQAAQRLCRLPNESSLLWQQLPAGIDAGAFHSDVLAVSNANVLLLHEQAFVDTDGLLDTLRKRLGDELQVCLAREAELSTANAVAAYPFNSQLVTLPDGSMAVVAPSDAKDLSPAREFLERAQSEVAQISKVFYVNLSGSMNNGGGPACLRLRVLLSEQERAAIGARVFLDDELYDSLKRWIIDHYRTALTFDDFRDPLLVDEVERALDELTQLLNLGSIYAFQI